MSIITEMELLGYPGADEAGLADVKRFLSRVAVVGLDDRLKHDSIAIRRSHRLKLPDAIIAATARCLDAELFTLDKDFNRVERLRTRPAAIF